MSIASSLRDTLAKIKNITSSHRKKQEEIKKKAKDLLIEAIKEGDQAKIDILKNKINQL